MADAPLAAFLRSANVFVLPLMVTYFGSNPRSTSTPSSRVGRSRTWPTVAFTSYPEPRYLPIVLAFVGDSTMTRAVPPDRLRATTPLPLAPLFRAAGALATGLVPLSATAMPADFPPAFPAPARFAGACFAVPAAF